MHKLQMMRPLRLYKNKTFYIHDLVGDKRHGHLFLISSLTTEEVINTINSELINTRYINSYYEKRLLELKAQNIFRRSRNNVKEDYKIIKSRTNTIKRTYPNASQYNGLNIFYDISSQNKLFFNSVKLNNKRKAELYAEYLKSLLDDEEFNNYPKKLIIIPTDGLKFRGENSANTLTSILNLVFYNEVLFQETFKDLEFLVVSNSQNLIFKFDSNTLTKKMIPRFKTLLTTIEKLQDGEELTPDESKLLEETKNELKTPTVQPNHVKVMNTITRAFTGSVSNNPLDYIRNLDGKQLELIDKMEDVAEKVSNKKNVKSATDLLDELNTNKEFIEYAEQLKNETLTASLSRQNTKRNELLQQDQKTRKINDTGRTLEEILNDFESQKMDREHYNIRTLNEGLKTSTLKDFEVSYNKKQKEKDTLAILNSFSDSNKEIPVYIRKIEKKNTSDSFNKKETWTIHMEDERRTRHTITIDIPLFIDDHFLYLSESKKTISHQLMLLPIVKTGPDTVQCTSNYNKAFIFRYGTKISPKIERLKKLTSVTKSNKLTFINGDNSLVNTKYLTNIDYDELANTFMHIDFGDISLKFNQEEFRQELLEKKINVNSLPDNELPIGIKGNKLIILDVETNKVKGTQLDLPDYIISELVKVDTSLQDELERVNVPKKYVYSRVSVLSKRFPLVLLLAFKDGLSTVIKKAGIKHEFSEKRRRLSLTEKNTIGEVQFADGFLYYDLYPFKNSLLLNALQELPTASYNYEVFDSKEVYLDLFETMFGTRNIAKGFDNFTELFLDPITKEVAESVNLPTDFTEFFLYANALLEDNAYTPENNMSLYRIRSNEIINGLLYKVLSNAYATYKNTANSNNPIKMSVPRDALLKELNACTIIQDYSIINPIYEAEAYGSVTYKGPSGLTKYLFQKIL